VHVFCNIAILGSSLRMEFIFLLTFYTTFSQGVAFAWYEVFVVQWTTRAAKKTSLKNTFFKSKNLKLVLKIYSNVENFEPSAILINEMKFIGFQFESRYGDSGFHTTGMLPHRIHSQVLYAIILKCLSSWRGKWVRPAFRMWIAVLKTCTPLLS